MMFPLHQTENQRVDLIQDSDRVMLRSTVDQSQIVQSNQSIKSSNLLKPGDRAAYHPDGAEAIYHFQIDPILWNIYKRENPDVYAGLMSRSQIQREKSAAKLAADHPEWVSCAPSIRRFDRG